MHNIAVLVGRVLNNELVKSAKEELNLYLKKR